MKEIKKQQFNWHGKTYYLLGENAEGVRYWLKKASWDCGWYWGIGYVETFTNNKAPQLSRDIASHQHFDGLFLKGGNCWDLFNGLLVETPLSINERWQLLELMSTAYTMREYADLLEQRGAHITNNPLADVIGNTAERDRINGEIIPAINEKIYELLTH